MSTPSDPVRVFVSYSRRDRGFVTSLCENLRLLRVPIWFDQLEVDPHGRTFTEAELRDALRTGLTQCSAILILLNKYSLCSPWVAYETATAQEIRSERPEFQVVGLATEKLASSVPSDVLQDAEILDFSAGYKTAIAKLGGLLTREIHVASGLDVHAAMMAATRNLQEGVTFPDHMRLCGVSPAQISRLEAARNALARFQQQPLVTDIVELVDMLDVGGRYDFLASGNLPLRVGVPGKQYALAVSFLPTLSLVVNRPSTMNARVEVVLLSLWPSSEQPRMSNMSTLMAQYNPDGSSFLWLSHEAHIHRYAMGSAEANSVLLTENRKMGDREWAFRWPINNPDENLLWHRQALANKLGLGQVQQSQKFKEPRNRGIGNWSAHSLWMAVSTMEKALPPVLLTEPKNWASDLWSSVIRGKWEQPEVSQPSALLGHLNMGGVLLFEVSRQSSVSPILAEQITQMTHCAGGRAFRLQVDPSVGDIQYVCVSPGWVDTTRGYAGLSACDEKSTSGGHHYM